MSNKWNKGEWSEFYTLLKLLADQKLYAGDEELKKLEQIFYPILKIITAKSSDKEKAYEFDEEGNVKFFNSQTATFTTVKRETIKNKITSIFDAIKTADISTFEIPIAEDLLSELGNPAIKGYSSKKSDIVLKIHDINTGYQPEVGFSIKSQV